MRVLFVSLLATLFFSGCSKKSNDNNPQPTGSTTTTNNNNTNTNTANNKLYVFENDTALAFITKWNNKKIVCRNVDTHYTQDSVTITLTKVISNGFSVEYDGHYVLRVVKSYEHGYGSNNDTINYLAFKNNRFIQRIPELHTHVSPWVIEPLESYLDFWVMDDKTLWFSSAAISTTDKGFKIIN